MRQKLERLRGVYRAGPYEIHTKHWWSPRERKSARLAARIIEHEAQAFLIPNPDDPLTLQATEPDGTVIVTGYGARSFL